MIGTCFPTADSLRAGMRHALAIETMQKATGAALFKGFDKWFEVRTDGDYPVKA
jgi:bacillopeptidase F (M6 metalloprotease family)